MVLLVHPHQEGLVVVVPAGESEGLITRGQEVDKPGERPSQRSSYSPDPAAVGPITGHARSQQKGGDRLVKQEVVIDQLLLFFLRHVLQGVVLPLQVPV